MIVAETPSLGRSIVDLLVDERIDCRLVSDLTDRELATWAPGREPVVVVACNEPYCRTARRWSRGELGGAPLVVVGARDPELWRLPGVRVVPLPLHREPLLALLRDLVSGRYSAVSP